MDANEEPDSIQLNARNLRGIAHPMRVRMLGMLRTDGPATATTLARRLGLNTGATSYHLRQLAEYGFIVEDPDRGTRRERWWKAAQLTTNSDSELFADDTGLGIGYLRSVAQGYAENTMRAVDALPTLPEQWRRAQDLSDYLCTLSPTQAQELSTEIHAVLRRYTTDDPRQLQRPPEGTARVTFQFQLFPNAEDVGARDADEQTPDGDDTARGQGR